MSNKHTHKKQKPVITDSEKQPRPYKIQRPLASSGPFEYLVYPRGKKPIYTMPGPDASLDQLMAGLPKIYVLAHFDETGKIIIHHLLPDQAF